MLKCVLVVHLLFCHLLLLLLTLVLLLSADSDVTKRYIMVDKVVLIWIVMLLSLLIMSVLNCFRVLVRQLVWLVRLVNWVDDMCTASRTFLHALRPLVGVRTEARWVEVLIRAKMRLLGLRRNSGLVEHLGVLWQRSLNMLRLLRLVVIVMKTGRGSTCTASSGWVSHLTLTDGLVIEFAQSIPICLEPILASFALVVAVGLITFGLERACGLTEDVHSSVEEARLGNGWRLLHHMVVTWISLLTVPAVGLLWLIRLLDFTIAHMMRITGSLADRLGSDVIRVGALRECVSQANLLGVPSCQTDIIHRFNQ